MVVATPTYKATYTGLLKSFLDRYPADGLKDVCAVPLMTGADRTHSMAPEVNLSPLLVELGAIVPVRGLYFETPLMARADEVLAAWGERHAQALASIRRGANARSEDAVRGAR